MKYSRPSVGLVLLLAASCFAGWGQPLRADPGQGRGPGLVHAPQRVPVAMPKSVDVRFETPMSITLEAETGATSASYAIDAPPAHGTVTLLGQYANYTPAAGFVGSDSFTFTVTTVDGTSAPATVSLNVKAIVPPTVPDAGADVPFNTRWDITLLFSDTNPAGPFQVSFAIVTPPTHGSVVLHGRTATYMPTLGYAGADSFTYTASTINGTSNVGTAGLTVLPGKLPLAQAGSAVTPYETPVSITLAASDANPGGPFALAYAIVTPPQHGSIGDFDADAGTLTYTPDSGYYGADEFRFNAATVNGTSAPATVSLAVIPPPPQLALAADAAAIYARYGQVLDYTFTLTNDGGQVDSTVTATFTPSVGFDESYAHIACFGAGAGASCEPDVADPWRFNVALPPGRSLTWFVSAPVRYDTSAPDVEMAMSAIGTSSVSIARASTLVIHRDGFEATDELLATRVDGAAAKALLDGDALREIVVPRLPAKTTTLLRVRDGARELRVEGRELAGIVLVRLREVDARGQQRASAWGTSQVGDTLTLGSEAAPNPSQAVADGSSRTLVLVGAQLAVRL